MSRFKPEILAGYKHADAELPSEVVYKERPNYPQDQIKSIGDLVVGTTVWRAHPGKYSSKTPQYVIDAMLSGRKAVGPPRVTWYSQPYLERLKIIGTGV